MKTIQTMSHDELVAFINLISEFNEKAVPELKKAGRFFSKENQERFFVGIEILSAFPACMMFCQTARRINTNYDQYCTTMLNHLERMTRNLASKVQNTTQHGENIVFLGQTQALRRGRPTPQESERRRIEKERAEMGHAIARLTGAKVVTTEPAPIEDRESDTSRRKQQEEDLFGSAINNAAKDIKQEEQDSSLGADVPDEMNLKSLREWLFILSEPLANQVKSVKELRAEQAHHCEKAKLLLESGASEEEIAEHTKLAKEINKQLAYIFIGVDYELALAYVMLKYVNTEYGGWAKKYESHGGYDILINDLEPYFNKVTSEGEHSVSYDQLLTKARKIEEDRIAAETRDPEKEKQIHAIKTYFGRKDVNPSPARFKGLKERYQQAVELGVDEDTLAGFQVIIEKMKSDLAVPEASGQAAADTTEKSAE